jgi:hypothetical protein
VEAKIAFGRKLWQETLIPDPNKISSLDFVFNNLMHMFIVFLLPQNLTTSL